jgi:accessory gene regulator B
MGMENKLKLKISLTEKLAEKITLKLNMRLNKEGLELKKMKLGLEILLINLTKFIIIFSLAAYFGLLKEALFMTLIFGSVRKSSFGLHANNSIICTIISALMFIGGPYLGYHLIINNYLVFMFFVPANILLYKYAPADTTNHPLLGKALRDKLKRQSVLTGIILMILALVVQSKPLKAMIMMAVAYQIVNILPITYKILNRRYKNYEKYERTNC